MSQPHSALLTGYPGLLARRVAAQLLEDGLQGELLLLVQPQRLAQANQAVARLPARRGARVRVLAGDVLDLHFGLAGPGFRTLAEGVHALFHLAETSNPSAPEAQLRRVNLEGTRNVLDIASELPNLRAIHHLSSTFVSGDREGVVAEDELDQGQRVSDPYAASKLAAEKLMVRARSRLPVTIYRPPFVVGDSRTGEIDRMEGPLYLALRLGASALPALPVTAGADQPLHVVPVDFAARAIAALARNPHAAGRTFQLLDPNPLSLRRAYEAVAELAGKRLQLLPVPRAAAEVVLRMPLVERLLRPQRRGLAQAGQMVFYTQAEAAPLLAEAGLLCPPLRSYLPRLLEAVRSGMAERREAGVQDALDGDGLG